MTFIGIDISPEMGLSQVARTRLTPPRAGVFLLPLAQKQDYLSAAFTALPNPPSACAASQVNTA